MEWSEQLETCLINRNLRQGSYQQVRNSVDRGRVQCSLRAYEVGDTIFSETTILHASSKKMLCNRCPKQPKRVRVEMKDLMKLIISQGLPCQGSCDTVQLQLLQCYVHHSGSTPIRQWVEELDTTHDHENGRIVVKQYAKITKKPIWFPHDQRLQKHQLGAQRCNVHEDDSGFGSSLFFLSSQIEHSCEPNCVFINKQSGHCVTLQCIRPIQEDEPISISYTPTLYINMKYRRKRLYRQYRFSCYCTLCRCDTDIRAGFQCPKCTTTLFPQAVAKDKGVTTYIRSGVRCWVCANTVTKNWDKHVEGLEKELYQRYWSCTRFTSVESYARRFTLQNGTSVMNLPSNLFDISTLLRQQKRIRGIGAQDPRNSAILHNLLYLCYYSARTMSSDGVLEYGLLENLDEKVVAGSVTRIRKCTVDVIKLWMYTIKQFEQCDPHLSYEKMCILDHMAQICYTVGKTRLALQIWRQCVDLALVVCGAGETVQHFKKLLQKPPASLAELVHRCS